MQVFNYIILGYFVVLCALIMWKGNAFLRLPPTQQVALGLGLFTPFAGWIVLHHVLS